MAIYTGAYLAAFLGRSDTATCRTSVPPGKFTIFREQDHRAVEALFEPERSHCSLLGVQLHKTALPLMRHLSSVRLAQSRSLQSMENAPSLAWHINRSLPGFSREFMTWKRRCCIYSAFMKLKQSRLAGTESWLCRMACLRGLQGG